jgi:uncharacterized membrane protein
MKMIEAFLQGKWLKHPLHPAIVHIPVSMWISSVVFDFLGLTGTADSLVMAHLAFYAILLGLLVAFFAIPTGIADWSGIQQGRPAWTIGILHMGLNWLASLAFAVSLGRRTGMDFTVDTLSLILSTVGVIVLLVSAYLGGRLSYEYGISVARHSKKQWESIAEMGKARIPAKEEGAQNA